MLLLHIVNKYFPSFRDKAIFQKHTLLDIQNTYAFVFLSYIMICIFQFVRYQDFTYIIHCLRPMPYYFICDLLLCEPIIFIHHGASFMLLQIYNHNLQMNPNVYYIQSPIYTIAFTEISTFFLTLKCFLHKYRNQSRLLTHIYNIINVVFAITFFYTRLYLFGSEFVNGNYYFLILQYDTIPQRVLSHISIYAILFLNIYWSSLILQKIFKPKVYTTPQRIQNNGTL